MSDKTESDYHFRVGIRFLANGELSEAREAFTTSLTLRTQPKTLCYRGLAYFMGKEYEKALADYTSAIQFDDPSIPEIYYFRGTLHGLLGNNGEAIRDLTKAIELNGETWRVEAYYYQGANFRAIGEYDMAIDDMRMAARAGHRLVQEFLKAKGLIENHLSSERQYQTAPTYAGNRLDTGAFERKEGGRYRAILSMQQRIPSSCLLPV